MKLRAVAAGVSALGAAALAAVAIFIARPLPPQLLDYRPIASVRIVDREGGLLRELWSSAEGRATPLPAADIPLRVRQAFMAAEDGRFESHPGVDPMGIIRAAVRDAQAGAAVEGGSTLTQQLARTLVPRERTLLGKAQEALWALRLEAHLSKEEILTQYLNRTAFGNGTIGIEAASQLYFGRKTGLLSVGQAAALASLPRGPTAYNPYRSAERLRARRTWVLARMTALGTLSAEDARRAADEPFDLQAFSAAFRAPHFVEYVTRNLARWGLSGAVTVETTLDPRLQQTAEESVERELGRLKDRRVSSAAVIALDNATGEVLAYQGSADFFDEEIAGQNDGVQMRRQPGSALKPFAYAEALHAGFTPASVLPDVEVHFGDAAGDYAPKNYDRHSHGPVRLREALANSYNVPAVRVAEALGPSRLLGVLRRAGFGTLQESAEHYGLGLVLGDGEVTLWDAARAYAGLARGGVVNPLRAIRRALRADGSEIPLPDELRPRRFANAEAVALVTDILSDNGARVRAFGMDNALRFPFAVAAKTGTSKGYSDNWTLGFTRERTVGVWAGNFDGSPMIQVSGVTGAGPIFHRVMVAAMAGMTPAPLVERGQFETVRICPLSGKRAGPRCPAAMEEVFAPGTAPHDDCDEHRTLAALLPRALAERCRNLAGAQGQLDDLGSEYYAWERAEGRAEEPWLAGLCAGSEGSERGDGSARIDSPGHGADYLIYPDLPLADQAIPVRVRARPEDGPFELRLDGEPVLSLDAPYVGRIPAEAGEHVLALFRRGETSPLAETSFHVRGERSQW